MTNLRIEITFQGKVQFSCYWAQWKDNEVFYKIVIQNKSWYRFARPHFGWWRSVLQMGLQNIEIGLKPYNYNIERSIGPILVQIGSIER